MRVTWMRGAADALENLDPALRAAVESETETMFMDSVPGEAVKLQPGLLMLELPCGVEVDFERMGDGVRILFLESRPKGRERIDFKAFDPSAPD
jgi:hypothetical protein